MGLRPRLVPSLLRPAQRKEPLVTEPTPQPTGNGISPTPITDPPSSLGAALDEGPKTTEAVDMVASAPWECRQRCRSSMSITPWRLSCRCKPWACPSPASKAIPS